MIPTWRRRDLLARVLAALAPQAPHAVIVVDNGSADGSAELAAGRGARVIALPENRGFAHAVNRGIEAAETDLVGIVNNDVEPASGWLATLIAALERQPDAWFATGKLLAPDGRLDGAFDLLSRAGLAWRAGSGRADSPVWNEPRRIASAPMTAALFRRALFAEVGGLDEDYGSYYEDVDFGLRCALAGRPGLYVPEARAVHAGNATLGGGWSAATVRLLARNQALLARKHLGRIPRAQALWGLLALRHGQFGAWLAGRRAGRAVPLRQPPADPDAVRAILAAQERELRALQQATGGLDTLWRIM